MRRDPTTPNPKIATLAKKRDLSPETWNDELLVLDVELKLIIINRELETSASIPNSWTVNPKALPDRTEPWT